VAEENARVGIVVGGLEVLHAVAAVAAMLPPDSPADDFWMWTEDPPEWRELVVPEGEVADWEVWGFADASSLYVHVEMPCATGPTDLTLRLYIHDADSDSPRVELDDLHVM
jgi:hypothetical protein